MVNSIIPAFPEKSRMPQNDGSSIIEISELFTNTVQGEGKYIGYPATFLRMKKCTLNCGFCDTTEVWRSGNSYSAMELLEIFDNFDIVNLLVNGQHLVLTGGSPLLQQKSLVEFFSLFKSKYHFLPFVEIENEAVLMPIDGILQYVSHWNNSPKLSNSNMRKNVRYKSNIIRLLSNFGDISSFKFVVSKEEDWKEIEEDFLKTHLIQKDQIILMPEGTSREELRKNYNFVLDLACKYNVRMTDRLQITIFDRTVGV